MTLLPIPPAGRLVVEKPADSFTCLPYPSRFPHFSVTLCLSDDIFHMLTLAFKFSTFHILHLSHPSLTLSFKVSHTFLCSKKKIFQHIDFPSILPTSLLNQIFLEHIFLWQSGRLDGQHGASKGVCAQAFEGGRI